MSAKCANAVDAKIAPMIVAAAAIVTGMRIVSTKIAVFAIVVTDADMMIVGADAEQMIPPETCDGAVALMMDLAICAVVVERMMALITSGAGVDAMMRRAMIAADAAASVMTAAPMIGAVMTGRTEIADVDEIQTIWRIASMTAIQPPTPLARVAGVGAVEAAVAEETTVPETTEPAGSRAAPVWHNRTGAVLPHMN